jgi:hypothetical protein
MPSAAPTYGQGAQVQGMMNQAFAQPTYQPQVQPQPQINPSDYVNGIHIDKLVNRALPKASNPGFASAETLTRDFRLPIEQTAELLNESHVRLEDWTMDLYNQASELAHHNVALQNMALDQQDAIVQQDELLRVYAQQHLNHQEFVKELLPHLDRYEKMEELLLDSTKLADYYRNLAAVEAEYGTHQQNVEAQQKAQQAENNRQREFIQYLVNQGYDLNQISDEQLAQAYRQAVAQSQPQAPTQAPYTVEPGTLPYAPGELLGRVDPNALTPEQLQRVQNMSPQELADLEYSMAVQMGVIQPQEQTQAQPRTGYSQYVGNTPTPTPQQVLAANPGMPMDVRAAIQGGNVPPAQPAQQQAQSVSQIPATRRNFYQQVIDGAIPPSPIETNRMIADGRYAEERATYNPLTTLDEKSLSSLRPTFPVANPRGESVSYPALDEVPASHRFLLLDKLEKEGILGQGRVRAF